MTIDLLPLASLGTESTAGPQRVAAEPRTLTLKLSRAALLSSREPAMSGTIAFQPLPQEAGRTARAAVLPSNAPALTITF
jgi:hypothetical protein